MVLYKAEFLLTAKDAINNNGFFPVGAREFPIML